MRRVEGRRCARSPTHKAHPDPCGCELDEGEVVFRVLLEARGDGAEVLELVEEALDEVALAVEEGAERRAPLTVRHRLDASPGAARGEGLAKGVAVVAGVGEEHLAGNDRVEKTACARPVVGLPGREVERDRQAVGIDYGVNLRRQPAPRAPQASGVRVVPGGGERREEPPFLAFAPCWWTRMVVESTIWMSPS